MQRVIAYIDGFNLYFGLREKGWKKYYWLNVRQVALQLLKPHQILTATKYFTSIISGPPDKQRRQATFLEALATLPDFHLYHGHYLTDSVTCKRCGFAYTTHHEKMTDVNIATELLCDAFADTYDVALLISADSDLVSPIKRVRCLFPRKRIIVVFPPARRSNALKNAAHILLHLDQSTLARSVFADQVTNAAGYVLHRPSSWR